jgi:hypothetical protein
MRLANSGLRVQRATLAILVLGAAAPSLAVQVKDELGMSNTRSTSENPRSGNVSNSLEAIFDWGDDWSMSAGVLATVEGATPAPPGSAFGDRGGLVSNLSAGVEYHPDDSWFFGMTADFSPRSTQRSGMQLNIVNTTGATSSANALLRAISSSSELQLTTGFDSNGQSAVEWSLSADVALTRFETDQRIVALQESNGNVASTTAIEKYCQTHTCSKALLHVLGPQPAATLDSGKIGLGGSLTFLRDTDLTLSGDYYAYRQDPTQVGYFSVGGAGRMQIAGGTGIPIAPLRYLVRPEVAQRLGDFSIRLWAQAGRYVAETGQTTRGIGIKLQYKFNKAFKMWAMGIGQRDVDSQGGVSRSATFALGAGYRF